LINKIKKGTLIQQQKIKTIKPHHVASLKQKEKIPFFDWE
jgi:hypothetical protein